jgi:hypothetical protein
MTLLEEIQLKCSPEEILEGNFHNIAATVSAGRVKAVSKIGGVGTVMDTLGAEGGAALLDALEAMAATNSAVKWAFVLINNGTLDFGLDSTRAMITALVPSPAKEALLSMSEVPDPVTWKQCNDAIEFGV